jgi:hypothetical protein
MSHRLHIEAIETLKDLKCNNKLLIFTAEKSPLKTNCVFVYIIHISSLCVYGLNTHTHTVHFLTS